MSGRTSKNGFTSPGSAISGVSARTSSTRRARGTPIAGPLGRSPASSSSRGGKSPASAAGSSPAYRFPNSPSGTASPASYRFPASPTSRGSRTPRRIQHRDVNMRSPLNYMSPLSSKSGETRSGATRTPASTPIRHRPDINFGGQMRVIDLGPLDGDVDERHLVIWGTNVSATEFKTKFRRFIDNFRVDEAAEDEVNDEFDFDQPLYVQKLHELKLLELTYLNINCEHLRKYDCEMYEQLIRYPQEVIPTMDTIVTEVYCLHFPDDVLTQQINVRPFNADKTKTMRFLNPEDIDHLVTFNGMVIRASNIMPEMVEGFFKCSLCAHTAQAEIDRGKILEPTLCVTCNKPYTFAMIHNRCKFSDKQMIRLQEDLEDTPTGETPYMVALFAHKDLVNSVQPGDRVTVTGIYRSAPLRVNPFMRTLRAVYKTHVDVLHFRKVDTKRLREIGDGTGIQLSPERIDYIRELSRKPDIYERLARAIAPSIYEHEDVKKGILLQLFGGTVKDFTAAGRGRFRAEINILLCGDPGTSKSQLLKYVFDLIPRSQYTSGKGSSAVGLTAYVTKDPETRQIVLQTGALVLADNGICCIDEFDKMSDSTRSILHEVMEQQTLSIAKAGIICQLNARTSVLAAANPIESQWNKRKTIVDNVNLPHTLLSRFDLIFLLMDPDNDAYDRKLGKHMISLYFQKQEAQDSDFLDMTVLRDYIAFAKETIHPRITPEASQRLIEAYVGMRQASNRPGVISAYPRQLESLIRLAEAHAKVRLSEHVEVFDVEEAVRIHREAVKASCTDPNTGIVDINILATGQSMAQRKRIQEIGKSLKKLMETNYKSGMVGKQKLFEELRAQSSISIPRDTFDDVLKDMEDEGVITTSGRSGIKLCTL